MEWYEKREAARAYAVAGTFALALRLVVGWTYFSAFWRRVVLENKLIPDDPGYIGEKFNHFLPHSIGIRPLIEYLVSTPDALWWAMVVFTIVEGVVGLLFMFGLFTRLMSLGVTLLALGILLGSGWIGTTCLDEWQIGILGVAAGFTIFLTGGGRFSLDRMWVRRRPGLAERKWFPWLASGPLGLNMRQIGRVSAVGAVCAAALTLYTNQVFHGGVWGPLHNKSARPVVELTDAAMGNGQLAFTVNRVEGADVYGSFLIGIELRDAAGKTVLSRDGEALARFPEADIANVYVTRVMPGKHSLVIPLGAKARLTLRDDVLQTLPPGRYELVLTDVSGQAWSSGVEVR